MIYLGIQRGRWKCNRVLIVIDCINKTALCFFCMMRADADAFAAVNALIRGNNSLSVTNANGLGGTVLDAVCTALTLIFQ